MNRDLPSEKGDPDDFPHMRGDEPTTVFLALHLLLSSIVVKQKKKATVSVVIQGLFMLMAGLEPARREAGDFRTALCCQSRLRVAVWTMSWPYHSGYRPLVYSLYTLPPASAGGLARRNPIRTFAELASIHTRGFPAGCSVFASKSPVSAIPPHQRDEGIIHRGA